MELLISISATQTVPWVVDHIKSVLRTGKGYGSRSCYGKIAHYLATHQVSDQAVVYLMGTRLGREDRVTHAALYDHGLPVVDTFGGHLDGDLYRFNDDQVDVLAKIKVKELK